MTIAIIGYPAAGKTKVGRRIAHKLEVPFVDTDAVIASEHGAIPEIFASRGEAYFRQVERDVVARTLAEGGVVSLGGGAILNEDTQSDLEQHTVILFTVDPSDVVNRLSDGKRPLSSGIDAWIALVESRKEIYHRLADVVFDTTRRKREEIADDVVAWIRERADE